MRFANYRSLLGVISAMMIWALWFVTVYALGGIGCDAGWNDIPVPGGNALSLVMLLSTALALALMCWCAIVGYRGWRRSSGGEVEGQEARRRMHFMGLAMLVLSIIAAISTLMIAISILMLEPCAA